MSLLLALTNAAPTLNPPLIASTAQFFAPSVVQVVAPPAIASTETFFGPTAQVTVGVPVVGPDSQIYAPTASNLNRLTNTETIPTFNTSVRFDAYADRLEGPGVTAPNAYTACGWVYISSARAAADAVVVSITDTGNYHRLRLRGASGLDFTVGSNLGTLSIATLSTGNWYFWAIKSDSSYNISGYIGTPTDATLTKGTTTGISSGWTTTRTNIAGDTVSSTHINGRIGLVRVWNRTLTDAEIETERWASAPASVTNLLGFWKIETAATVLSATVGSALTNPGSAGAWANESGPPIGAEPFAASASNLNTVFPPLIGSTETFYAHSIAIAGATLTVPQIASTETIFAHTVSNLNTLTVPQIASTETIFAPSLSNLSTLTVPQIASTASVFSPAVSNLNTLTVPQIASTATLYAPTVIQSQFLSPPLIGSTEALYAPTLAQVTALAPPQIASTETIFAPSLSNLSTLTVPQIASTATLYAPVVRNANTLTAPLVGSTETIFAPSVGRGVSPPQISSTATLFAPSLSNLSTLTVPQIPSAVQFFGGALGSQLSPPVVGPNSQVFSPTVTPGAVTLTVPQIASAATLYAPAVSNFNTLTVPQIASTASLFAPTVTSGAVTLTVPQIASTATFFGASVGAGAIALSPPQIASTATLFAPTSKNVSILAPPQIASTATVSAPNVSNLNTLTVPQIASTASVFAPNVQRVLGAPQIASNEQVFVPTLSQILSAPYIAATSQVYVPQVQTNGSIGIPFIPSGEQVLSPSVIYSIFPPIVVGGEVYSPSITRGEGWPQPTESLPLVRSLELPLPETLTRIVGIHQSDIVIRSAIEAALADLRANHRLLDYVFGSLPQDTLTWKEYGEKDLQEAKKWFMSTKIGVSVLPRMDESRWPQITIELLESSEVQPEATIGDVNYDPVEENDMTWPALTPKFTPVSYVPSTGIVKLAAEPEAWIGPGMFIIDKQGTAHEIIESIDEKTFRIDPMTVADFRMSVIKGHRPNWKVDVESSSFKETYRIGVHCVNEPVHLSWLHSIVQFALLRYKQVLLEARGFERSTISSSQVALDQRFETENVLTRYIMVSGFVRQFWPKTIAPVIDGVEMDGVYGNERYKLAVSGQNADVSVEQAGTDPDTAPWIGNLDTIRKP